jgi:DNA-binding NarL/FixJ family response regulator
MTTTLVALVDDYEIVRHGLRALFAQQDDMAVVAEAGTCAEALTEVPLANPDVVVVDVRLPDGDGIGLCADLAVVAPDLRCVVLTAYADDAAMLRAVDAGVAAFVLKEADGTVLVTAVRDVARGESLLDPRTAALARARDDGGTADLTPQESRVVALVSEGMTNRQIGEHLGLSEKTVKNYVSNVLAKLGMARRSEVAVYGARHGLLASAAGLS